MNIFLSPEDCETALAALPAGVAYDSVAIETIKRDGQVRLFWDDTPVDLFFSDLPIHDAAERNRREVPFEGEKIPVLAPLELAVFKVMSDRTRDWADIEAMLAARTLDVDALRNWLAKLVGNDDSRLARLDEALRRTDKP